MDYKRIPGVDLMHAHLRGDNLAFQELMTRYYRYAFSIAREGTRDDDEAADAVESMWFDVYQKRSDTTLEFANEGRLLSWLKTIVQRRKVDIRRRSPEGRFEASAGSPRIRRSDLLKPKDLLTRIQNVDGPLFEYLRSEFQEILRKFDDMDGSSSIAENIIEDTANKLNDIILDPHLFQEKRFEGIALTPFTQSLLKQDMLDSKSRVFLNRALLDDAFRDQIKPVSVRDMPATVSIDAPINSDQAGETFQDRIAGEEMGVDDHVISNSLMDDIMGCLEGNEKMYFRWRYTIGLGNNEVCAKMGVSPVSGSRINARIVKKAKVFFEAAADLGEGGE